MFLIFFSNADNSDICGPWVLQGSGPVPVCLKRWSPPAKNTEKQQEKMKKQKARPALKSLRNEISPQRFSLIPVHNPSTIIALEV